MVTGTTFNAHQEILDKVKSINNQNLDLVRVNLEESPSNQDYRVIIVFCPIISRVGTDIEAAMRKVTGKKKVFLFMYVKNTDNTTYYLYNSVNIYHHMPYWPLNLFQAKIFL